MIQLDINTSEIEGIVSTLQPTEKQAIAALKSTLNKMSRWLSSRTTKGLGKELNLTQKIIRRRFRKSTVISTTDGYAIRLFYGLNDVALIHLNPKKTSTGITASKRKVDGAFISKRKNQVFKRVGKERLPLEKQVEIIKSTADLYLESIEFNSSEFTNQFYKTLEHELKWRMKWME
ncbi:hypothetical protein ACG9Y7_04130 [Acinetobacter gerneri]|uniref:hypothetical protein n=1 Tax=Acinetobacter gerneri TaxID=202952 RepID=UPI003AF5C3F9